MLAIHCWKGRSVAVYVMWCNKCWFFANLAEGFSCRVHSLLYGDKCWLCMDNANCYVVSGKWGRWTWQYKSADVRWDSGHADFHLFCCHLTYVDIFMQLHTLLHGAVLSTDLRLSGSVISSDEECGLVKTICDIFHDATHLLCIQHLKDNDIDFMMNKCGMQQSMYTRLVDMVLLMFLFYGVILLDTYLAVFSRL